MTDLTELKRLSIRITAEMILGHQDPDGRDVRFHDQIEPLGLFDTYQVSGMVISALCDRIDTILANSPQARSMVDDQAKLLLVELDSSEGVPGE